MKFLGERVKREKKGGMRVRFRNFLVIIGWGKIEKVR